MGNVEAAYVEMVNCFDPQFSRLVTWLQTKNKHVVLPKTIVILPHPYLPIKATYPQRLLSSVPRVAVVEGFNCILLFAQTTNKIV